MPKPFAPTVPATRKLPFAFPLRQIHLDFHTSPFIPDVGSEFDAREFARTMKAAHVNSVTVFAKCHHGMCYYPTKTGRSHPALGQRDLLGEMIEALHAEGIRAPIYTTVAWEEDVAARRPEWRQMSADGTFARAGNPDHSATPHPGGWHFCDWVNPEYQDYIEAQTREICDRYEVDGFFYDIVFYANDAHHSEVARTFRQRHGLTQDSFETFKRFEALAQDQFAARFTRLLNGLAPGATVFYNSSLDVTVDSTVGGRVRNKHMTHIEVESLPSGFWGYYHFPRLARSCGRWGRPWLGMTGRFQKMWGDFGGIKPQPALEFECFRTQALGGGNSVGDQLPPRGRPDAAAYALIGAVYEQCEYAEPFYEGSEPLRQVGVFTANYPGLSRARGSRADEGVIQMCEETHYDATLLDELDSLDPYELLILPDSTVVTPTLYPKLKRHHERGGQLLISHRAGRDAHGNWALDFLPLRFDGDVELHPTYWRARRGFWPELSASDRVIYNQGTNVVPSRDLEVLVDRVLPYFKRNDLTFSSHFQTPPVARPDRHPAVVAGPGFVYFADPIFREYRESGNLAARDVWKRCVERLIGPAPIGAGLPTTMLVVPRRRGRDLLITLLHYVPLRKALQVDVLEERMSFAGEVLHVRDASAVRVFGTHQTLPQDASGGFVLPSVKGRLLLDAPGYFTAPRRKR
jgi:hypothetical protein